MSSDSSSFIASALGLPDDERANLAYQLLQSLPPPGVLDVEESTFADELDRRASDYAEGKIGAAEWDDAVRRLRDELQNKAVS